VFGAAAATALVWLTSLGRGLTFFYDEWDFVNAAATTNYWHQVLQAHNGHLVMVPYTVYEVLLKTVGLRHYWPYQLFLNVLDVVCGWLLFVLLRRKVHPVVAASAAAVLMLLGPAWQDLLWPFQIAFLGSVAAGLGALVLLDRNTTRADVGACLCLAVAVGCSGVGITFAAGVGVELLWRRQHWLRLWVPVAPLVLFAAWNAKYGDSSLSSTSPVSMVHASASATAATVGAIIGRGTVAGAVIAVVLGVLVLVALVRSPARAGRLAMAVTGLLSFWILTVLTRGATQGGQSRYLYPAAALVLVATAELPSLIQTKSPLHRPAHPPSWVPVVTYVAVAGVVAYASLAIWWNASALDTSATGLAANSAVVRAKLGAVVLAGSALPAGFRPDTQYMPQVTVGPFLRAVAAFGSPGDSRRDLENAPAPLRSAVDAMLLQGRSFSVSGTGALTSSATARCQHDQLDPIEPTETIALHSRGAIVVSNGNVPLVVRARSLASTLSAVATVPPGAASVVRWSVRPTHLTWQVQFEVVQSAAPGAPSVTVCTLSGGGGSQRVSADTLRS
jgi:hypothetical protein